MCKYYVWPCALCKCIHVGIIEQLVCSGFGWSGFTLYFHIPTVLLISDKKVDRHRQHIYMYFCNSLGLQMESNK